MQQMLSSNLLGLGDSSYGVTLLCGVPSFETKSFQSPRLRRDRLKKLEYKIFVPAHISLNYNLTLRQPSIDRLHSNLPRAVSFESAICLSRSTPDTIEIGSSLAFRYA